MYGILSKLITDLFAFTLTVIEMVDELPERSVALTVHVCVPSWSAPVPLIAPLLHSYVIVALALSYSSNAVTLFKENFSPSLTSKLYGPS